MNSDELDGLLGELEGLLTAGPSQGWKPFWTKAKEIQEAFNAKVRYPTKQLRDAAWDRFNESRNAAARSRDEQKPSRDAQNLDSLINELTNLVRRGTWLFGPIPFRTIRCPTDALASAVHDWRSAWEKTREIQSIFNQGVRYPTKIAHDEAWTRFNNIRNELSHRTNQDRETVFEVSKAWRDWIINEIEAARYSRSDGVFLEIISWGLATITAEDIKKKQVFLKNAGEMLSRNKHQMLKEHKDECFQRIQEIRQTHDEFWGEYKALRERRQNEFRSRISATLASVESNIQKIEDKKAKSEEALARCEARIDELEEKIQSARSDEFREVVEGWLSKELEKKDSIRESIRRFEEWIAQDAARRDDIHKKMR